MANIRVWLEDFCAEHKETLIAVVVGQHEQSKDDGDDPLLDENVVLSPAAALAKLDEEFDDSDGTAYCFPMVAWTESHVLFLKLDEATPRITLEAAPRYPAAITPDFI